MKIRETGGNFEDPPIGTHLARCVGLIGIGTHKGNYNGKDYLKTELVISWELPNALRRDGEPFVVSGFYTRSLSPKANLRGVLVNWRGRDFTAEELKEFELQNVLDKPCQIVMSLSEKGKVRVNGVVGLPKGVTLPERKTALGYFDIEDTWDEAAFHNLSNWFQDKIKDSYEYRELQKFERILTFEERAEVERYGDQALTETFGHTPVNEVAAKPADPNYDDQIPF